MKEKIVTLDTFTPREYQLPFIQAFEKQTHKRFLLVWARRAGKDVCAFNLLFRAAMKVRGVYFYVAPSFVQCKKIIWDNIDNDGKSFLEYIPREAILRKNSQELKITLVNGSIIQLIGSTNIDSIMGSNPKGAIFSEYAMQSELAYQYLRPIFIANGGFTVFVSTPRGHNSFWDLYQAAKNDSKEWYSSVLTVADTGHISEEEINKEIAEGLMSYDLSRQEYYCDFSMGAAGSFYSKKIDLMRREGRITDVLYDPALPVNTSWDLGIADPTVCIFFQITKGNSIRIIDYYEKKRESIVEHVNYVKNKPYVYGTHIAPHDIRNHEQNNNTSRWETYHSLGITFKIAPGVEKKTFVEDGIEAVRIIFARLYIDEVRCKKLIRHLENYRSEYDDKLKIYKVKPVRDCHTHGADAMRYLALSLHMLQTGMTQQDVDRAKMRARGGYKRKLPSAFG